MNGEERAEILKILQSGRMETEGLLPWSSNYAFLVQVYEAASELRAVYKPSRGERPLWDFPTGALSYREYAAFLISDELGWNLVPPTVIRDGEHGSGSVQLFIEHDPNQHYFSFEGQPEFRTPLQKIVLLDVVINNADRKGGHVIIEESSGNEDIAGTDGPGRLWGIDHGICFHHDNKLRTVIWEFAGMEIPESLLSDPFYQPLYSHIPAHRSPIGDLDQASDVPQRSGMRRQPGLCPPFVVVLPPQLRGRWATARHGRLFHLLAQLRSATICRPKHFLQLPRLVLAPNRGRRERPAPPAGLR